MIDNTSSSLVTITEQEFQDIVAFVYQKYGIDLHKKKQLIMGRLSYTIKSKGLSSFTQYMQLLRADKTNTELQLFLNKITTNHSYFARETDHYDYLARTALPALEKTRRGELRIWSAGCSSGQEAHHIAMLLDEYFGSRKSQWDTVILATDISTNVLAKASTGIYPANDIKDVPDHWKKKYFNQLPNDTYQVIDRIRKEVVFRTGNLMEPFSYKQGFDIIFCRNVMIYFDHETNQNLIEKFYNVTKPDGYLFVGHSESVDKGRTKYQYVQPAVYHRPK